MSDGDRSAEEMIESANVLAHYPYNGWCHVEGSPLKAKDCPECRKNELARHVIKAVRGEFTFLGVGVEAEADSWMLAGRGMVEKLGLQVTGRRELVTGQAKYTFTMIVTPIKDAGDEEKGS